MNDFSVDLIVLQSLSNCLGAFFIITSREVCLKILIYLVLVNLLCYVDILEKDFFTILEFCHKNITRT